MSIAYASDKAPVAKNDIEYVEHNTQGVQIDTDKIVGDVDAGIEALRGQDLYYTEEGSFPRMRRSHFTLAN
jgi:hypothetical protein